MTVEGALPFPSRTLTGWGRQLASWHPRALWVGHIFLHRIEALMRCTLAANLDALRSRLLSGLTVAPGESLQQLHARLHLDRQLLDRMLRALQNEGLARFDGGWRPTDLGRTALGQGEHRQAVHQRRVFYFVEHERSDQPPHFVPLADPPTLPWPAGVEPKFDVNLLSACVERPVEWKRRIGFPQDVEALVDGTADTEPWRQVVLDRPERLLAVLAQVEGHGREQLHVFPVRQDGWTLGSEKPILTLDEEWPAVFPELAAGLPPQAWHEAWQTWCQASGLTGAEAIALQIKLEHHQLRVMVSDALMNRLQAQRSEALKGDAWVLAGGGRIRQIVALGLEDRSQQPE